MPKQMARGVCLEDRVRRDMLTGKMDEFLSCYDDAVKFPMDGDAWALFIMRYLYETVCEDVKLNIAVDFENVQMFDDSGLQVKSGLNIVDGYQFVAFEAGGDWEHPALVIAYVNIDGEWDMYVPVAGNTVCLKHKCAYGSCQDHGAPETEDADDACGGSDPEPNPGSAFMDIKASLMGAPPIHSKCAKITTADCRKAIVQWIKDNPGHVRNQFQYPPGHPWFEPGEDDQPFDEHAGAT